MGPHSVSAHSDFTQLDTQDLPGWNGTSKNTRLRGYRAERTCSRAETVEESNLVENAGPVLVLVEAGNVLANPAAGGLVFGRDVDLVLGNQTVERLNADRQKQSAFIQS